MSFPNWIKHEIQRAEERLSVLRGDPPEKIILTHRLNVLQECLFQYHRFHLGRRRCDG